MTPQRGGPLAYIFEYHLCASAEHSFARYISLVFYGLLTAGALPVCSVAPRHHQHRCQFHNIGKDGSKNAKVSANLKEKSLYTFMLAVSSYYHSSHNSVGLENGGRGLKVKIWEV